MGLPDAIRLLVNERQRIHSVIIQDDNCYVEFDTKLRATAEKLTRDETLFMLAMLTHPMLRPRTMELLLESSHA